MSLRSHPNLAALLVAILLFAFLVCIEGRWQDKANSASDTDRIYKGNEIDKKAVIDKKRRDLNAPSPTGCKGQNTVIIGAVLRKSGKVTNVRVFEPGNCPEFEKKAIKSVDRTKFKPAMKNGTPVSTYMSFQFNFNCDGECL